MRNIEGVIQLEIQKGPNKNRDLLIDLATQKKELKVAIDSLPTETAISREDMLIDCDHLLIKLGDAYTESLTDGSGGDASIDILINNISTIRGTLI